MNQNTYNFLQLAYQNNVLSFGDFTLKSGRKSPYFFNAGKFSNSSSLAMLGQCYAQALKESNVSFDGLFGPAYKGIPLATTTAVAWHNMAQPALNVTFDRKEVKAHGEGGQLIGSDLKGDIILLDDVISAGTAARHSIELIKNSGANTCAFLIGLDRQEKGKSELSAATELAKEFELQVISIAKLDDLLDFVKQDDALTHYSDKICAYRDKYGA